VLLSFRPLAENSSHPLSDCVTIGKTTHIGVFVIPGLTRNPLFFQSFTLLDAGRDRHDRHKLDAFLNYDTVCLRLVVDFGLTAYAWYFKGDKNIFIPVLGLGLETISYFHKQDQWKKIL
jgi:hypothetical protein